MPNKDFCFASCRTLKNIVFGRSFINRVLMFFNNFFLDCEKNWLKAQESTTSSWWKEVSSTLVVWKSCSGSSREIYRTRSCCPGEGILSSLDRHADSYGFLWKRSVATSHPEIILKWIFKRFLCETFWIGNTWTIVVNPFKGTDPECLSFSENMVWFLIFRHFGLFGLGGGMIVH